MNVLMKTVHGSHLYGLETPNSDVDYKGIFLPELNDLLLEKSPKQMSRTTGDNFSKNGADDVDESLYSLRYFIDLACQGETICIDMLHVSPDMCLESSPEWEFIYNHRYRFYTSTMKAFLGYARKQAAKYGVKGSRMGALEEVVNCLPSFVQHRWPGKPKLDVISNTLPVNDHCYFTSDTLRNDTVQFFYVVLGSKYQLSMPLEDFIHAIKLKWDSYGERARAAKNNEGVDWKAMSHALRAGYQLKEIFTKGDLKFPFEGYTRSYLMDVKQGKLDFTTNVQLELEKVIEEVEDLAKKVNFPEKVDRKFWDNFLLDTYKERYNI